MTKQMTKVSVLEAMEAIKESLSLNVESDRVIETVVPGETAIRQGDIYIHAVESNHERGEKTANTKLAEGSSKGSSHYAQGSGFTVYKGVKAPKGFKYSLSDLVGPFIEAKETFTIAHPEHSDIILPAGNYQITYQLDTRTMAKVRD